MFFNGHVFYRQNFSNFQFPNFQLPIIQLFLTAELDPRSNFSTVLKTIMRLKNVDATGARIVIDMTLEIGK